LNAAAERDIEMGLRRLSYFNEEGKCLGSFQSLTGGFSSEVYIVIFYKGRLWYR
jgi:hypothetical protein